MCQHCVQLHGVQRLRLRCWRLFTRWLPILGLLQLGKGRGHDRLRQALAQMRAWSDAGMGWEVSVNIAAPHFHRPNFVQRLKDIRHTCPEVSPSRLELEILESAALEDMQ